MASTPETGHLASTSAVSRLVPHEAVYGSVTLAVSAARGSVQYARAWTPETVCPVRFRAVSWFRRPGQGVRYNQAQVSAREIWSSTHTRRPPGAKCPVFMSVVTAVRCYVFGMPALRFATGEVSGGRVPIGI